MATKRVISRATKAKHAELEERIRQMRHEEDQLQAKIHKLEASIVAAPGWQAGARLSNRNWVQPDAEDDSPSRGFSRTRYQALRLNRARSTQALAAFFLLSVFIGFVCFFYYMLKINGLL